MFQAAHKHVLSGVPSFRAGEAITLGVTTPGVTDRYLRHKDSLGVTSTIGDDVSRRDMTFIMRKGQADDKCFSFESRNMPGHFLRQSKLRIRLDPLATSAEYKGDATFCLRNPRTKSGVAFESYSQKGKYLRHYNSEVYLASKGGSNKWENAYSWEADVSWIVASPLWRSGADIKTGSKVSLQVTTANFTNQYLRHKDSQTITSVISSSSDATSRQDATFTARSGMADPSCYSFEAVNAPGTFVFRMKTAR